MFSQASNITNSIKYNSKPVSSAKYLNAVGETTPKSQVARRQISSDDWLIDYYPKDEGKQTKSIITLKTISKNFDLLFDFDARDFLLIKRRRTQKILEQY